MAGRATRGNVRQRSHGGVHADLSETHRRVTAIYAEWDSIYYDIDKEGEGHCRFHPQSLPPQKKLVRIAEMGSENNYTHQHAQRTWSPIIHHSAWVSFLARLHGVSGREAVRFVAREVVASCPHDGANTGLLSEPASAPCGGVPWGGHMVGSHGGVPWWCPIGGVP